VTFVCEQIEREAAQLAIADLPSRETVRVFLSQEISPAMKALAREGQREYRERMAPYIRRGYVDVWANQIWVGDHMIHDVEVANDLFDDAPFGAPVRLRLSAMLDYRSRKLVGATWCWEGSSRAIAATMRRAILQFGPPEGIYVDNGKDYIKVARGARKGSEAWIEESPLAPNQWWQSEYDAIERTGFLARLGISVTHCIPRHPQSKHVERFFRTLHTRFDSVHSTYTSGSPATRPDQTEAAMMLHRRLFKKGRVAESSHPLASQFILGCLSWIDEYNATPHSGESMDGRSPNEVFAAELNPNQKPTPEPAALALLMAERERREVHECAITLNKRRYAPRSEDRMAWAAMHEFNEREVLIVFDPGDPECAAAVTLDGHFIAWLEAEQLLRFAPGDVETQRQIGQSMEIRRGLEKAAKSTLRAIAGAARANGAQSAQESLYSRLQLPSPAAGPVISQRKPRLRPDKAAVAPSSAADIANDFLEGIK
jgi:putative transposase